MRLMLIIITGFLLSASTVAGRTWRVPDEAATIQEGILLADAGDTVIVACGTYQEHDLQMRSGIVLRSETGLPDCVIIDAQGLDRVMTCTDADGTTRLEGLTFTGGEDRLNDFDLTAGGLLCVNSPLRISRCNFVDNLCETGGGGISCREGSDALIEDCLCADNIGWHGGGLSCYSSAPTVIRCTFQNNWVSPTYGQGGGVACFYGSPATFSYCTFAGNEASRGGGLVTGVSSDPSPVQLDHCTIADNVVTLIGGGASLTGGTCGIDDSSIYGNTAGEEGGGLHLWNSHLTAFNTDIQANTGTAGQDVFSYLESVALLNCCDVDLARCGGPGELILDLSVCEGVLPTETRSWGSVKAQYR